MVRVLPVLFNAEMVCATLDERKTVIRRLVKLPNYIKRQEDGGYTLYADGTCYENQCFEQIISYLKKPCQPGDILYVRETWCNANKEGAEPDYYYYADVHKCEDYCKTEWKWRPSIHMPKEAARIWLKVTDVRVERLWDMKTEDFLSEGILGAEYEIETKNRFKKLWDSTLRKSALDSYGWNANPWVWVTEFGRCEKPDPCILEGVEPAQDKKPCYSNKFD